MSVGGGGGGVQLDVGNQHCEQTFFSFYDTAKCGNHSFLVGILLAVYLNHVTIHGVRVAHLPHSQAQGTPPELFFLTF